MLKAVDGVQRRTELQYFLPIPGAPMIVEHFMSIARSHFLHTGSESVHVRPVALDSLAISSCGSREVVQRISTLTCLSVGLNVSLWNGDSQFDTAQIDINIGT